MDDFIKELFNIAKQSIINHKLVAVIIKCNNILSKPCSNTPKISKKNIFDYYIISNTIHAEENAIINYFGKNFYYNKCKNLVYLPNNIKKNNIDLFVARFNKNGLMTNARPCYNCLLLMKHVGIRKVYYTTTDGIICEHINDMVSILITSSLKNNNKKLNQINNYNLLLQIQFNKPIYEYNLHLFIKYNLTNILPKYTYKIYKNKKIIFIYDEYNNIIVKTHII